MSRVSPFPPLPNAAPTVRREEAVTYRPLADLPAAPQNPRAAVPPTEIQTVRIELGRRRLTPHERRALRPGTIVTLDEPVDEPVNVYRDDVLLARGRLVLLEDKLCVRVTERIG